MDTLLFIALLVLPLLGAASCIALQTPRAVLRSLLVTVLGETAVSLFAAFRVFADGAPIFGADRWLFLDALSAYNLFVMALVFTLSALYAVSYFGAEITAGKLDLRSARQFGSLYSATMSAMTLVLISNHMAIMWIGMEATTLLTAFLICLHVTSTSLEAMWKYLLVCSVGVAFAFVGTLMVEISTLRLTGPHLELLWTDLRSRAASLDADSLRAAFIFLMVGYGTKAGLSPMHSWLPDAHSQAPAPVSALFSGFMLNAALYCILRFVPLVEAATGQHGFCLELLVGFGLASMSVAAAFILFQKDVKRLLAYSSVEHIGIMAVGVGLGPLGTLAALLHALNHAVAKPLAFFSAGKLGQSRGTHDIEALAGALRRSPLWGTGLLASLLCLIGCAPFGIFMTELLIVRAAVEKKSFVTLGLFLFTASVVFVGALRHALVLAWGRREVDPESIAIRGETGRDDGSSQRIDRWLVGGSVAISAGLGLWLPEKLRGILEVAAAAVVGGAR